MQLFAPSANTLARLVLASLIVVPLGALGLITLLPFTPYVTRQNVVVPQPVPFSHQHHVGQLGLDCRYCHLGVETSSYAGIPDTKTCMTCHSQIWTNAPMLAPVRQSLAEGRPLHWHRVNRLPDYVYFDHSIHVAKGIGCSSCHGDVAQMPLLRQTAPLTMDWCVSCHRDPRPALRPPEQIFNTDWKAPADQNRVGQRLLEFYQIHPAHLTDCSVCHR